MCYCGEVITTKAKGKKKMKTEDVDRMAVEALGEEAQREYMGMRRRGVECHKALTLMNNNRIKVSRSGEVEIYERVGFCNNGCWRRV